MQGEVRKVQLTGGATLIVSLPKEWAKRVSLMPGDEVLIVTQPDDTLVVIPRKLGKKTGVSVQMTVASSVPVEEIERIFIALYIGGAETIVVRFSPDAIGLRRQVKDFVRRRVVDMEIVEEASDHLVIQSMISATDLAINELIGNMLKLVEHMSLDLIKGLDADDMILLRDIIDRDDEVDRLYWLVERQLKRASMSRYIMMDLKIDDPRDIVEYMIIAKSIERMADHVCRIAYVGQEEKVDLRLLKPLLEEDIQFIRSVQKLITEGEVSPKALAELHREMTAWSHRVRSEEVPPDPVTSVARESAVRIGEYSADIVEAMTRIKLKDKTLTLAA